VRFIVQGGIGVSGQGSQQVVTPKGGNADQTPFSLSIQNVGGTPIWIADNQGNLNTSVDTTGTPNYGFVLPANMPAPFNDPRWIGPVFALTAGPSGLLEVKVSQC